MSTTFCSTAFPPFTESCKFIELITSHDLFFFTSKSAAQCDGNCNNASRNSDNLGPTRKQRPNQTQPHARTAYCHKVPFIEISISQNRIKSHAHKYQDDKNRVDFPRKGNFRIPTLNPRSIRITKANRYRKPHRNRDQHQKKYSAVTSGNLDFFTAPGIKGNISPALATATFRNDQRVNASSGANQAITTPDKCNTKSAGLIR